MDTFDFPELEITSELETGKKLRVDYYLLRHLSWEFFSNTGKKSLYTLCVKILHLHALTNVKESNGKRLFGLGASPKGSWRTLYKPPIEKRTGDLQWRLVHGIIATNRHRARLDPQVREGCPFCGIQETVFHLF